MGAELAEELRPIVTWLGDAELASTYSSGAWNDPSDERSKEWWIADGSEAAYSRLQSYLDDSGLTDDYKIAERYIAGIPKDGLEVADLAAGIGWTSAQLSKLLNVGAVHAVEISRHRLELLFPRANLMFRGEPAKLRRYLGSFYDLGFGERSMDVVFLSAAFHHASNPLRLLNEIDRVLKPGGHLVMIGENVIGATAILRRAVKVLLLNRQLCTNFYELFPPDDIWGDHYYRASDYFLFLQMLGYEVVKFSVQKKRTAVIVARSSARPETQSG
jgi:ubiquinone/menaquinone biosynthesis C-methylase UbiE